MSKCDCYHKQEYYANGYLCSVKYECWGTRERDECSCGGDRTKCDFYPEVREKALKEQEPKFGEWISVKEKLPKKFGKYLTCDECGNMHVFTYREDALYPFGISPDNEEYNMVSHWMPLPQPPKGE